MEIRNPRRGELKAVMELAVDAKGPERAGPFVRSEVERQHPLVAETESEVVRMLAYRTDCFQCTFVSLVSVRKDFRRRGIARSLFAKAEETNCVSIQMHTAPGFVRSGQIDNLPQGYRELLFYKRLRPYETG